MARIALVACSKKKAGHRAPAAVLYTSALFRKSLLAALDVSKSIHVLSAKHGVVRLGEVIEPYDVTLKSMPSAERSAWGQATGEQLSRLLHPGDVATLFCGEEYIAPLRRRISQLGCRIDLPLAGLSMGQRLQRLRGLNREAALEADLRRFYRIVRKLWLAQKKGRRIADCSGKLSWPERGVYLVLDGETAISERSIPRIIRVGTHAVSLGSRTSLWNRVSTHRGTESGGGSHRSSIFRSHVGRALMNSDPSENWPDSWADGETAPASVRENELTLEQQVSRTIGQMKLLWLNIPDTAGPTSDRAYIERNAIGLLSRAILLSPRRALPWLGQASDDWRIAISGLWNLDHLFLTPDPTFLDVLEIYVEVTIGRHPLPTSSLAPSGWRSQQSGELAQLSLFDGQNDNHV